MELASKSSEMLLASAYVIGHRTGRMALAGPRPSARDRREFTLMGQEKMDAAIASATAMTQQMARANLQFGMMAARQMMGAGTALLALGSSRTASQLVTRQAALARTLMPSAPSATHVLQSTARTLKHGLQPIHARATANSRRLRSLRVVPPFGAK